MVLKAKLMPEFTDHGRTCQLTLTVHERLYNGLQSAAKKQGISRAEYASVLLNAAHAARFGGTGDGQLEDVVGATLLLWGNDWDSARIATALHITEPQVLHIMKTWRSKQRCKAS